MPFDDLFTRRAAFRPTSLDRGNRTVRVTVSTGAAVQRRGYIERLTLPDPQTIVGLPVLNSHRQDGLDNLLGRVVAAGVDDAGLWADVQISERADWLLGEIEAGIVTSASIGYRQGKATRSTDAATGQAVHTIVPDITEISFVPVPADKGATIRSNQVENDEITVDENATETCNDDRTQNRAAIRQIARAAGMTSEQADDMVDRELSITEARAEAFEAMQDRGRRTPCIRTAQCEVTPHATVLQHRVDALAFRMAGGELPERSREFVNMSFRDLAADCLVRAGESPVGLSTDELFTRAAAHGTSDFPLVISNAMNKVALDSYRAAESPLKALARQRTLPNFKDSTSIRLGEMGRFGEMTEHGEFPHTSRAEAGETMRLKTFGQGINLSRKLLIDDDQNMLGDITAAIGTAAAQTEADELVATFTGNPNLSDGTGVFDASRGNVAAAGAALSEETLDAARKSMRAVKGLDGKTIIGVTPRFLVVGPELETAAEKLLAAIYAATTDDVQPIKLKLVVEPRITGTGWYVMADPASVPSLQFAYLSSAQGVQIQRQEAWNTLGMQYRAFLDFGTGWADWRGAYLNPGV